MSDVQLESLDTAKRSFGLPQGSCERHRVDRNIAVSSFAMKGDEDKARAAGCDHYVTKPYSPIQLLRIVRGFLGEKT